MSIKPMLNSRFQTGICRAFVCTVALVGVFSMGPAHLSAQELEHPEKPLLWKVEGGDLEKPSYLFGTIHLGTGPLAKLHPAAAKALDSADFVYTEVSFEPAMQMAMADSAVRKDGKTLSESIGPELTSQLEAELKRINPALDLEPLEQFKTWMVGMTLQVLPSQLKGEKAVDLLIWETADAAGKACEGLEKAGDQIAIFDDFSEPEQIAILSETLRMMREDRAAERDSIAALIAAYVAGDPERIQAEVDASVKAMAEGEHKEIGVRLMKRLLADRDVSMSETMAAKLAAHPGRSHFFAVGVGHYVGEPNIRSYLRDKGYTITRITE